MKAIHPAVLAAVGLLLTLASSPSDAAYTWAEPDLYPVNTAIPDDIGVKLRNASYRPGHIEFDRGWRRIYAKATDTFPFVIPSTGELVLGNEPIHAFNGPNAGLRAWFVDIDNNPRPASYVGFDICWPSDLTRAEGAEVTVYGNDIDGNEIVIFNRVYLPQHPYTPVQITAPGITWMSIICWNDPRYFRQQYFSVDALRFVNQPGAAFAVAPDDPLEAPLGLDIGEQESLTGEGTVIGDVTNSGRVRPGRSPGTLTIDGDYEQTSLGVLEIEIDGEAPGEHDVLAVLGLVELAGTLLVVLDEHQPALDASFTVLTAAEVAGTFDNISVAGGAPGLWFQPTYHDDRVVLTAVPEPGSLALMLLAGAMLLRRRAASAR